MLHGAWQDLQGGVDEELGVGSLVHVTSGCQIASSSSVCTEKMAAGDVEMMLVADALPLPWRLVAMFYVGLATYVTLSIKNEDKFGVKTLLPRTVSDYFIIVAACALALGITGLDLAW